MVSAVVCLSRSQFSGRETGRKGGCTKTGLKISGIRTYEEIHSNLKFIFKSLSICKEEIRRAMQQSVFPLIFLTLFLKAVFKCQMSTLHRKKTYYFDSLILRDQRSRLVSITSHWLLTGNSLHPFVASPTVFSTLLPAFSVQWLLLGHFCMQSCFLRIFYLPEELHNFWPNPRTVQDVENHIRSSIIKVVCIIYVRPKQQRP